MTANRNRMFALISTQTAARLTLAATLFNLVLPVAPALAAPQGGTVVNGQVDIQAQGDLTQITASNNAIIDFASFNIAAQETVRFIQPAETARVLNRVMDGNATQIDGSLLANGRVYLLNPAGIFFGDTAIVNVGHLTAAAGTITSADFLNGVDRFGDVSGPVINAGSIEADAVNLLGSRVANLGSIVAPDGLVTMTAGEEVYLGSIDGGVMVQISSPSGQSPDTAGEPAVSNAGSIQAPGGRVMMGAADIYALAASNSGSITASNVELRGEGGRVEVSGTIDATSDSGAGGTVHVLGDQVAVRSGAVIDASGTTGGGDIRVGGDFQGGGDLPTASRTLVEDATLLAVDALLSGDGGTVIVWADEVTGYDGHISARGGSLGGDGGFAEVSGKQHLYFSGTADLLAPAGERGALLLDPKNGTVQAGGGTVITGDRLFTDNPAGDETYDPADIVALLDGANLFLLFNTDFTVNSPIDASGNIGNGDLNIAVGRSIFINADITLRGNFDAKANVPTFEGVDPANRDAGPGGFIMAANTTIDTSLANGAIDIVVERGVGGAQSDDLRVFNLSAGDGPIFLEQFGESIGSSIEINGLVQTNFGGVEIVAIGPLGTSNVLLNGQIQTNGGSVEIEATQDFVMASTSSIGASGGGSVEVFAGLLHGPGAISMADGAIITADGTLDLFATDNIIIGRLVSSDPFSDAMIISSRQGSILDAGDTGGADIEAAATGAGVEITAAAIGAAGDAIELNVDALRANTEAFDGDQFVFIADGINITQQPETDSLNVRAGLGSIELEFGGVTGVFDTDAALDLVADFVTVIGAGDLGSAVAPINVASANPDFSGVTGNVFTDFNVTDVFLSAPVNQAGTFFLSASGNLVVDASITITGTSGNVTLISSGDLTVNSPIEIQGAFANIDIHADGNLIVNDVLTATNSNSSVDAAANGDVTFNAGSGIATLDGSIDVEADREFSGNPLSGSIIMADGVTFDAGAGEIELFAAGDIVIGRLVAGAFIEIESFAGSILDGGDTGGADIVATTGGIEIESFTGIGAFTDDLEVTAAEIEARNLGMTGGIDLTLNDVSTGVVLGELLHLGPNPLDLNASAADLTLDDEAFAPSAQFFLANTGNLVINDSVLAANVLLQAAIGGAGTLTFGDTDVAIAGNTVALVAGAGAGTGSIDAQANFPRFFNALGDDAPATFTFRQQLDIDTAGAQFPLTPQFGPAAGFDGMNLILESLTGSVTTSDPGPFVFGDVTIDAALDINISGNTMLNVGTLTAGRDIFINNTVGALGGLTATADRSITVSADLSTGGQPLVLSANAAGASAGNFVAVTIDGATLDVVGNPFGGDILITGIGGDTGGGNSGVQVLNGAVLQTNGNGTINITAVARGTTSNNIGFRMFGGSLIRNVGGPGQIIVNATGGDGTDFNHGASITDLGTRISTDTGGVTLTGTAGNSSGTNSIGIDLFDAEVTSPAGPINITGTGGGGVDNNIGVNITQNNALVQTGGGDITITGTGGGSGDGNIGVNIGSNASVLTSNFGNIIILGTGADAGNSNTGVFISGASTFIQTTTGDITLTGFGGNGSGNFNTGVEQRGVVESLTNSTIFISGTGGNGAGGANVGVSIAFGAVNVVDGSLTIEGFGGDGTGFDFNIGVELSSGATIQAAGNAPINIVGVGGDGSNQDTGIRISNDSTSVHVMDADLTLNGTSGILGGGGITLSDSAAVMSEGLGNVFLAGGGANGFIDIIQSTLGSPSMAGFIDADTDADVFISDSTLIAPMVTLRAGNDGFGDLRIVTGISQSAFNADTIDLSAGDGVSGVASVIIDDGTALFTDFAATGSPLTFSVIQDADLTATTSLPAVTDFAGAPNPAASYIIESRNGSIIIDEGLRLSNTTLQANAALDITFSSDLTNTTLTADAGQDIVVNAALDGPAITLDAFRSVQINADATGFNTTLLANVQGLATGNFVGIDINNALVSGQSSLLISGTGGDTGDDNNGVRIRNGALINNSDPAGTIDITGAGGPGGTRNHGVSIEGVGTAVSTIDGALTITGTGGAGTGLSNAGLNLSNQAVIESTGAGQITLTGTGGAGASAGNSGVLVFDIGTIRSDTAPIDITGFAGSGTSNAGVTISGAGLSFGRVESLTSAPINITGTGGDGAASRGVNISGGILGAGNNVTIIGTGGTGVGSPSEGVQLNGPLSNIQITGAGDLTINGTAGPNGLNGAHGVLIQETNIQTDFGSVSITGTGGGTGSANSGITIENAAVINSGASLFLTGAGSASATGSNNFGVALNDTVQLTTSGTITVDATAGANTPVALNMADGTLLDAAAASLVIDTLNGDAVLSSLTTTSTSPTAVTVTATNGAIADGGDTFTDIDAPNGTVTLLADNGIGDGNQIEIRANSVDLTNNLTGNLEAHLIDVAQVLNITQNAPDPFITNITFESSAGGLNILISNLNLSGNATLGGSTDNDTFQVDADITDVTLLTINAGDGDDQLLVDFTFDITNITFNGEAGVDSITLSNGAFNEVRHVFNSASDGSININNGADGAITYTGLEPIVDTITATNRVFEFTSADDVITLGDDGVAGNGLSRIASIGSSELVDFAAPSNTLSIFTGDSTAADQVTIARLDSTASTLFVRVESSGNLDIPSADTQAALNLILLDNFNSRTLTTGSLSADRQLLIAGGNDGDDLAVINGPAFSQTGVIVSNIATATFNDTLTSNFSINVNSSADTVVFNAPVTSNGFQRYDNDTVVAAADLTDANAAGFIEFDSDLILNADVLVTAHDATFNGRINSDSPASPRRLDVDTFGNGLTIFLGTIGAGENDAIGGGDDRPLFSLVTNADGAVKLGSPIILVDGDNTAQFDDAAELTADVNITELGPGNVVFGSTLDSAPGTSFDLEVSTLGGGDTVFTGEVGGNEPLGSITTDAAGQIVLGADVTVVDSVDFNDLLVLNDSVTIAGEQVNTDGGIDLNGNTLTIEIIEPPSNASGSIAEVLPDNDSDDEEKDSPTAQSGDSGSRLGSADTVDALASTLAPFGIALPPELRDRQALQQLQSSYDSFLLTQLPGMPFDPAAYLAFLRAAPDEQSTLTVLAAIRAVIDELERSPADDDEKAEARRRILETLAPDGMTPEQLESVIQQVQPPAPPQPVALLHAEASS